MKYTWGEFKADTGAGMLNGMAFGLIYAFYSIPFQFHKEDVKTKYKGRPILYYGSWCGRMALAFGILRVTYNALNKEQVGLGMEIGGMAFATIAVSQILF